MVNAIDQNETEILVKPKDANRGEECTVETEVFKAVVNQDLSQLKLIFATRNVEPDLYDKEGMTPLQHACYKGNKDIVDFLIEKVNNL